jgi:hypothetical protein
MDDHMKREQAKAMMKEASTALVAMGTSAGVATAAGSSAGMIALTGGASLLPWALTAVIAIARGWKEREAARWWYELLHGQGDEQATSEEIAGLIAAHQEEPFVRETILRSVRAIGEAVDPAAVSPLALLAREYVREQKAPDAFFRGASRLLAELSATEVFDLRRLLSWVLVETARDDVTVNAHEWKRVAGELRKVPWYIELLRDEFVGTTTESPNRDAVTTGISDPLRLFHLLRTNNLGSEGQGVAFDAGPGKVVLARVTIERLRRLLGSE